MNICVLSGSPKGKESITLQTALFIEKNFPMDKFTVCHVGREINALEKDMSPVREAVENADVLLFCYPVYTFIVPSQLHRFIELLKRSDISVSGKYAAQICTSKHFYDVTAMRFITDNISDMGMKYLGGFSADMEDLLSKKGRHEAFLFWKMVRFRYKNDITLPADVPPSRVKPYKKLFDSENMPEKSDRFDTVIVSAAEKGDKQLEAMINDFRGAYPYKTRVVNICETRMDGGCLGCFGCAASGKCVYKDGFDEFLRSGIQSASAIIYAYTVKDHSMGSRMKMFDDRQFCNGHRTVTAGKPVGYIVNGCLENEENLKTVMQARADVGGNYFAGAAEDGEGIKALAKTVDYALRNKMRAPRSFYGVGGMKIFRDLIWLMQGIMKADHEFFMKNGLYDFPQYHPASVMKMKLVGTLASNPKLMEKAGVNMTESMLAPYEKVLEQNSKPNK